MKWFLVLLFAFLFQASVMAENYVFIEYPCFDERFRDDLLDLIDTTDTSLVEDDDGRVVVRVPLGDNSPIVGERVFFSRNVTPEDEIRMIGFVIGIEHEPSQGWKDYHSPWGIR